MLIVVVIGLSLLAAGAADTDISGTWACTIEMGEPKPTNVKFAFKQEGEKLSGTYSGPRGDYPVTGKVNGDRVAFSYELSLGKGSMRVNGTIASPTKMTGTVEWIGGGVPPGKWTATKKSG